VIVDDGSTDDTPAYLDALKGQILPSGITLSIIHQVNAGAPAARNRGLAEATGEYVIFWDADTIAPDNFLQILYATLVAHPEAAYAYSQFKFGWKLMKVPEFDPELLKRVNFVDITSLIRRSAAIPHDESLKKFQDWDLWLTLLEQGKYGVRASGTSYQKLVGHRRGISSWLPSFMYRLPFKTKQVKVYEAAAEIIRKKHGLKK